MHTAAAQAFGARLIRCSVVIIIIFDKRVSDFAVSCIHIEDESPSRLSDYFISKMETVLHDVNVLG
jgi:hypothetical protein